MSNAPDDAQRSARHDLDHIDWRMHHVSVGDSPGDFTPVRRPVHHEEEQSPLDALWELLSGGEPGRQRPEPEREAG
jgi:hypothetical protein